MSETKVKFYRGKTWNPATEGEPTNNGEVVMINDAMYDQVGTGEGQISQEEYNSRKKFGSVYQDDKIVGTTKASELRLTEDIDVSNAVGNIISGDKLTKGMSVEDILAELLSAPVKYPSCQPASVSFSGIKNAGTITASSTTPYVGQTVTFTYPTTATATITFNKTKYTNGGSTTSAIPEGTNQAFYTDATGTTVANPSFSISNGDSSWVATWGTGKTVKQQISVNTTVYGAPVLKSDGSFYLPLDSNGNETTKTGKYDADYSVVYAVNENGEESRVALAVNSTIPGAIKTAKGQLPYAYYKKGSEPTSYSFEKIGSGDTKEWSTPATKGETCPTYIIPYQYKTASGSWTNTGAITLDVHMGQGTYSYKINAGATSFTTDSNTTNGKTGTVGVLSDIYVLDESNGTWSVSDSIDGKVAVKFLKIELVTTINSTDDNDYCTVKIG